MLPLARRAPSRASDLLVLALTAVAVLFAPTGSVRAATTIVQHSLQWSTDALEIAPSPDGALLGMHDATPLHVEGRPVLPRTSMNFVLPRGLAIVGVQLADAQWIDVDVTALAPSTGVVSSDGDVVFDTWGETGSAERGVAYPAQPVSVGSTAIFRGWSVGSIDVVPVRVQADGRVQQLVRADVRLELDYDPQITTAALREVAWPGRDRTDADFVRAIVRNADDVVRYAPPRGVDPSTARFDFEVGVGEGLARVARVVPEAIDLLIITTPGLAPEFERLAQWRTQEGLRAAVVTTDEITAVARPGGDLQETLRNYLKTAYAQWGVNYLLLGGDAELLPPRYARSTFYPLGGYTDIPTDLYFACLDGNWNLDADGDYAEPYRDFLNTGDQADMLGELAVGRAPVKSLAQAKTFVDKILAYENPVNKGFAGRALFLSEVLFPQEWDGVAPITLDGATYAEDIVFNSIIGGGNLMQSWRMYENYAAFFGSIPETRSAALDSMDTGHFGLVNHVGHGFYYNMSVGDANIFVADAQTLSNSNPFVLHALNCSSGAFDFDCLLESFIQDADGGAVATVGSSRAAFPSTANVYQQDFFERIFVNGTVRIGDAQLLARSDQVSSTAVEGSHRWTHFTYHVFSDPTLRVWREEPKTPSVTHVASVNLGTPTLNVTVTAGAAVVGATVAATRPDGGFAVQTTIAGGQAVLDLTGLSDRAGAIDLVVSGRNLLPYRTTVQVQSGSAAHVRATLSAIDDDASGASDGDGDASIDAGETVELIALVANNGTVTANNVSTDLVAVNAPGATIVQGTAISGTLAASASALAPAFVVGIDPTVADGTLLEFELVSTDGITTWTQPLQLLVQAPEVEVARIRWTDTAFGNGNGTIEAGESIELFVELVNYGGAGANQVTGTLSTGSGNVTIVDASNTWSSVGTAATSEGAGGFRISESDVAVENWMTLDLVGDGGQVWSHQFELRPLTAPVAPTLNTTFGPDRIALQLAAITQSHFAGYRVYRRDTQGGPFNEITTDRLLRTGFIMDDGLAALTRYAYQVSAVDSSGVESGRSPVVEASTAPPEQVGGFPLPVTRQLAGALAVGDMRGDGTKIVTFGSDWLYAIDANGEELANGDNDSQTRGPLAGNPSFPRWTPSGVSMADLDGDGADELVGSNWDSREVFVVNAQGQNLPGWPKVMNARAWATPVIADLDNNGDLEIIINNVASTLYVWNHDGTDFFDGDATPSTIGIFQKRVNESFSRSTPAVYDVDGDGTLEIIFGTVYRDGRDNVVHALRNNATDAPGWPKSVGTGGWNVSAVTVADLEYDGVAEIMLITEDDKLHIWEQDGTEIVGSPISLFTTAGARDSKQPPVTPADFDQDGVLELVAVSIINNSSSQVFVMEKNGTVLPGWPRNLPGLSESAPVIADINGDLLLDIVFGIGGGSDNAPNELFAFNRDGTDVQGFPITLQGAVRAVPVITDFNDDGDVDILYAGFDLFLHVWDMPFPFNPNLAPWPTFQGNARRTGVYGQDIPVGVIDAIVTARTSVRGVLLESLFSGAPNGLELDIDRRRVSEEHFVRIASGVETQGGELVFVDETAVPGETYQYRVLTTDGSFEVRTSEVYVPLRRLAFEGAVPNPFNPRTEIKFEVPGTAGGQVPVRLALYDVSGRLVRTLHVGPLGPGSHRSTWDGTDDRGRTVSSGTYFARLEGAGQSETLKVTLLK